LHSTARQDGGYNRPLFDSRIRGDAAVRECSPPLRKNNFEIEGTDEPPFDIVGKVEPPSKKTNFEIEDTVELCISRFLKSRRPNWMNFQLALLMKCMMTRHRPTFLLLSLIVVRIVIVNGIPVMHGPPAVARGIPVLLHR
jgi:hypothetical protein